MQGNSLIGTPSGGGSSNFRFPKLVSKNLAGKSIELPAGLPGERTVLLVAFQREQQHDLDGWVAGLHLDEGKIPWVELPVIDDPGAIGRWFIDSGMRRGISDHGNWTHVITLYLHKKDFMKQVGLSTDSTVYAMVVDREGQILLSIPGVFTANGAEQIQHAMRESPNVFIDSGIDR